MHTRLNTVLATALALGLLVLAAPPAQAQTFSVIGKAGGYLPVSDTYEITNELESLVVAKQADLALGGGIEISPLFWPVDLRIGADYLTGAEVTTDGVAGETVVADGTLLMLSGDVVLRPLPRIVVVQPYLLGGIGYKRETFDIADGASSELPENFSDYMVHAGLGVDLQFGGVGVLVEVTDYFGRPNSESRDGFFDVHHDVFASVGIKLGLF